MTGEAEPLSAPLNLSGFQVIWGGCAIEGSLILSTEKVATEIKSIEGSVDGKHVNTCFLVKINFLAIFWVFLHLFGSQRNVGMCQVWIFKFVRVKSSVFWSDNILDVTAQVSNISDSINIWQRMYYNEMKSWVLDWHHLFCLFFSKMCNWVLGGVKFNKFGDSESVWNGHLVKVWSALCAGNKFF